MSLKKIELTSGEEFVECPICDYDIYIFEGAKPFDRFDCPECGTKLQLRVQVVTSIETKLEKIE